MSDISAFQNLEQQARELLGEQNAPREVEALLRILREDLWQKSELALSARSKRYLTAVDQVKRGEPVQYVVESAHFFDYDFMVDKRVLIPRPETEELVQLVIESASEYKDPVILDVGTGSGCIAITLSRKLANAKIVGLDVSEDALNVARHNNNQLGTEVEFKRCDFLDQNAWSQFGQYDIIVSNPPYVLESESHLMNTLDYEPHLALFVDPEIGVEQFYGKLALFAKDHLSKAGQLFVEINQYAAQEIKVSMEKHGLAVAVLQDMQGNDRMIKCRGNL